MSVTKVTAPASGADDLGAREKVASPRYKRGRRAPAWRRRDRRAGYLYLLPAVALLGVFILYPLARVVQYSFQSWDGVGPATYVGFSNYEQLVQPPQSSALGHIGVLFIFFAIIPTGLGLMVASLIGRVRMRGMAIFRVIFFLPQVIITVVIAIVWTWLLAPSGAGSINGILHSLGLGPAVGPAYLGDFNTALISLGLIAVWVNFGLCFLLFLSGVQRISPELYDCSACRRGRSRSRVRAHYRSAPQAGDGGRAHYYDRNRLAELRPGLRGDKWRARDVDHRPRDPDIS